MQAEFVTTELIVAALLLIAALVAWLTKLVRFPYTVGLVIVGVTITVLLPEKPELAPELARELILLLLLPPLIFEAALHIEFSEFRDNLLAVLVFAIPGVLLTTVLVGWLMATVTGLPLTTMLVFGALISATDPVAVTAIFRDLGLPKRLGLLTEGESLLNDATAIVVFTLLLEFALH
ncbi:MAG TPA: cation:proton antiporter, partial [Anaerolineales bacterium]|nr:cation:proton antiporter [Anaerolineales bacterium]